MTPHSLVPVGAVHWDHAAWRGRFYPEGLPKRRWFEHFTHTFDTVEINNTFYRLPPESAFDAWRSAAR